MGTIVIVHRTGKKACHDMQELTQHRKAGFAWQTVSRPGHSVIRFDKREGPVIGGTEEIDIINCE
jgi:hypothetical protein